MGAINAAPSPPIYAVAAGFYRDAPYMLDLKLGPFAAATVITERAWSQISAEDQKKMLAAAKVMERTINSEAPGLDVRYIDEMKKNGLKLVTLDPKDLSTFKTTLEKLTNSQRGFLVPADAYDAAVRARDAFRKTGK